MKKIILGLVLVLGHYNLAKAELVLKESFHFDQIRSQQAVTSLASEKGPRMVIVDNTGRSSSEYRVFGYSEKQVLQSLNDEQGAACSDKHQQGDMGNRWCHAAVVKVIDRSLQSYGIDKTIAALIGAAFFVPKEFLIDMKPSKSDLVIADYQIYSDKDTSVEVTLFGDGMFFVVINKKF